MKLKKNWEGIYE